MVTRPETELTEILLNDTTPNEALNITHVEKIFGSGSASVVALNRVSATVQSNEFFTLLGPSGCGKTTLLRLIAGFEQPTSGEIFLFGEEIEGLPPHARPVNTVFQHYALFPHMTVAENIGFGLRMLKWSNQEIKSRVDETLDLVKMQEYATRKTNQLSGGQQQRIALARALAPKPKVLLLDEPLSALDLKLRQAMRYELKNLQRETGITFIFVTHDQEEALTMSDRIAVMSAGEIQQIGTPLDIYERPHNRFVADFIGDTNFLHASVTELSDATASCDVGGALSFKTDIVGTPKLGDRVTLALRPEKIKFATENTPSNLTARIDNATYIGTDTTYEVSIGDATKLTIRDQNFLSGEQRYQQGDQVQLRIASDSARMLID